MFRDMKGCFSCGSKWAGVDYLQNPLFWSFLMFVFGHLFTFFKRKNKLKEYFYDKMSQFSCMIAELQKTFYDLTPSPQYTNRNGNCGPRAKVPQWHISTPEMLETFVRPRDKTFKKEDEKTKGTRAQRQAIRLLKKEEMRKKWGRRKDFCPVRLRLSDKLW